MQRCGLTAADFGKYVATLRDWAYTAVPEAHLMDMTGGELLSLTPAVIDGQVDVDWTREPTRILTLTLLDPHHTLGFDSNAAADGAVFVDRMVRVEHRVYVPTLGDHVTCPLFYGPLRAFKRSGVLVYLTAYGMEHLAGGQLWNPLTITKGTRKTDAIRTIMGRAGETRYSMPDLTARLPANLSMGRTTVPWNAAKRVASSMDRQLFYNGSGRLILRDLPSKPLFTLRQGDTTDGKNGDALGEIEVNVDLTSGFYNVFEVVGAKPKGSKTRVRAVSVAPPGSQIDPWALGHNGVPLRYVSSTTNDHIRTTAEAQTSADRMLADQMRSVVQVTGDFKVFPFLEEGDTLAVSTRDGAVQFRLAQFTIPLGAGNPMPIGYQRRLTRNRRQSRWVHGKVKQ